MAPELSSNWKKLQTTLQAENKARAAVADRKRKAPPTQQQKNALAKKRRLEETSSKKTTVLSGRVVKNTVKMGNWNSTPVSVESNPKTPKPSASLALWAEDHDLSPADLAAAYGKDLTSTAAQSVQKDLVNGGLIVGVEVGKYVSLDCEMVQVGGAEEDRSALARISIVNFHGTQIYDSFVKPVEFVTDWRTHVSGVSSKHMATARTFSVVQSAVSEILNDRILVGHALQNDLDALMLSHPKRDIRDTSKFPKFREYAAGRTPSLKKLAKEVLGVEIQGGEHSSLEDARVTMLLFRRFKQGFDVEHQKRFPTFPPGTAAANAKAKKDKKRNVKR